MCLLAVECALDLLSDTVTKATNATSHARGHTSGASSSQSAKIEPKAVLDKHRYCITIDLEAHART